MTKRGLMVAAGIWAVAIVATAIVCLSVTAIVMGWAEEVWWLVALGGVVLGAFCTSVFLLMALAISDHE